MCIRDRLKLLYRKEDFTQDNNWPLLFSVTVPKRQFKSAVDRNLIKRRIREAYRLHKFEIQELLCKQNNKVLVTMFIYVGKEICSYQIIEKAIKTQLTYLRNEVV